MITVCFIRHAATAGNLQKRYIGRTDEPLCSYGVLQAQTLYASGLPAFYAVFTSPYLRCRQTAELLFPGTTPITADGLRECDFGMFEGKTAAELYECREYSRWLESGCTGAIPGGEDVSAFKARCCAAFEALASALPDGARAAIVTHGGCIMAILERFTRPASGFYDFHIKNCGHITYRFDGEQLLLIEAP